MYHVNEHVFVVFSQHISHVVSNIFKVQEAIYVNDTFQKYTHPVLGCGFVQYLTLGHHSSLRRTFYTL